MTQCGDELIAMHIGLKWADIDLKKGHALVRETKNDEQRTLPLAGKAEGCGNMYSLRAGVLKLQLAKRLKCWYAALDAVGIRRLSFP